MADFTDAAPPVDRPRDFRDSAWFRIAIVVAVVILGAVVVTRFLKHDVVSNWKLLATCPAASDAAAVPVSTTLDTQACSSAPIDPHDGRGWPIVAFVLPADVGLDPSITTVHSDKAEPPDVAGLRRTRTRRRAQQRRDGARLRRGPEQLAARRSVHGRRRDRAGHGDRRSGELSRPDDPG